MKTKLFLFLTTLTVFAAVHAPAQVGYVNFVFDTGNNWFGNPLDDRTNTVTSLFYNPPNGTTVSLWNTALNSWGASATYTTGSGWSNPNLQLMPGTGALLATLSPFTNTFVGGVDGFDSHGNYIIPAPYTVGGKFMLSCVAPMALPQPGLDVFLAIVGREPHNGEQFTTLDPLSQTYSTTTFLGGVWDTGAPSLGVGQAAMFTLVPEPSSICLLTVALGAFLVLRSKK